MKKASGDLLHTFIRVMNRFKQCLSNSALDYNLTPQQLGALYHLYADDSMTMRELAVRLHCDASNVTGITDRLVARNLVDRIEKPSDRRSKQLTVTPAGKKIIEEVEAALPECIGFDRLSADESASLGAILRKL